MLALLLSLASDTQRRKFDELYEQYKELVKFIALDVLKNDILAEEVVQEVFLRLFLKLDDIDDVKEFRTHGLVLIISRRVSYNKFKYEKRRAHETEEVIGKLRFDNVTEDVAIRKMEHERIFKALGEMNKEDFDLIALRHYYGYSYEELEDFFDMSSGALRKRYQRFREKIMSKYMSLKGELDEEAR